MCEATLRVAALTIFTWLTLIPAAGSAQISPAREDEPVQVVEAFTLEHQPAGEAVEIVRSLLSPRGRVELQGDSNTLVIRDAEEFVAKARALLVRYDHRPINLAFTIRLVMASRGSEQGESELPPKLTHRLREMLRYENFDERGHAEIVGREGQEVGYRVGDGFRVQFRVGTVLESRRLKLHDFQVFRTGKDQKKKALIHTRLVVRFGKTLVLGLARSESSGEALMVVLDTEPIVISPPVRDNPEPR